MTCICSGCFGNADFVEVGYDEKKQKFDLYFCADCKKYTRDFNLSARETVDLALSDNDTMSQPKQLPLFKVIKRFW